MLISSITTQFFNVRRLLELMKTRDVFRYAMQGRDIMDDFENLDIHSKREMVGLDNLATDIYSDILMTLDAIGFNADDIDLQTLLTPTLEIPRDESQDVNKKDSERMGFLPLNIPPMVQKESTQEALVNMTMSGYLNDILLDAPYDMAILAFNSMAKKQKEQMKR